jgi:hypothetical protein
MNEIVTKHNYYVPKGEYSQTCILRLLKGTWKCALYDQLPFIYKFKLHALFINGKMRLPFIYSGLLYMRCPLYTVICYTWDALYIQWFVIHEVPFTYSGLLYMRCPLYTVVCYTWGALYIQWFVIHEVPFKAGLTVFCFVIDIRTGATILFIRIWQIQCKSGRFSNSIDLFLQGRIQGGCTRCMPPLKSWLFTWNTPKIFTPPSTRCNFFNCIPPLTWNPGTAPVLYYFFPRNQCIYIIFHYNLHGMNHILKHL